MSSAGEARAIIDRLGLAPHPEGGWYRESWRGQAGPDGRAVATAIHFLLEEGQASRWHRVDAAEVWLWHAGSPLLLGMAQDDAGPVAESRLGGDVLGGEAPQVVIPTGWWQAARAPRGWALVSCVVAPGFEFSGFSLAAAGWWPGR